MVLYSDRNPIALPQIHLDFLHRSAKSLVFETQLSVLIIGLSLGKNSFKSTKMIMIHNFSKYTQFHRKWCIPTRISLSTAIRIHSPFDFECGFGRETTENVLKSTVDSANVFFTNNPLQMWFLQCKIATLRAFLPNNSTQTVLFAFLEPIFTKFPH